MGRRRAALVLGVPVVVLLIAFLALYAEGGFTAIAAFAVAPGVLPALAALNIALAIWRIAAGVDAARRSPRPRLAIAVVGPAILLLVLAPHLWVGETIAATDDLLSSMFGNGAVQTEGPPAVDDTPPPGWTFDPEVDGTPEPIVTLAPDASPTIAPTKAPLIARTSGTGSLPGLNVAVPWQRPGAVPWGNDGRFDLLLMGSDAGRDRWSRRMDVMLLVEIDVATGKVAMIGLPRNLVNAPFPPGPARDAVACGCFHNLLNALYVEATVIHPDRWPGSGAVGGIGAVRSVVSELTGRPVDAVLVADLWGLIKVVDAMGGLDIDIPSSVYDSHYPDPVYGTIELTIPAGHQHLNGRLALAYARTRHQDSDYSRMQRQQTFLLAVRDQIGPKTILNAPALVTAAKGFAWTDLPRAALPNLVNLFSKAANASVKQFRAVPPAYPEWLTPSVITKMQIAIAKLLGVPPPTPSLSPTGSPGTSLGPPPPSGSAPSPSHSPPPPTGSPGPT
jgi:LCP family protein required for cell wall assembly